MYTMSENKNGYWDDCIPQADLVCSKNFSCCHKKGCPGLYKVLSSGKLAFQNECC